MKIFKLILISAVAFFLLMLAFSLLIPSRVRISRAVDIQTSRQELMPLVTATAGWEKWNSLAKPGAGGELAITKVTDSLVLARFETKGHHIENGLAIYEIKPGTLTVQWYMDFYLSWYPWEKFGSILYDKQFGPVMEADLKQLKTLASSSFNQP